MLYFFIIVSESHLVDNTSGSVCVDDDITCALYYTYLNARRVARSIYGPEGWASILVFESERQVGDVWVQGRFVKSFPRCARFRSASTPSEARSPHS